MRDRLIELIQFAEIDFATVKNMHKSSAEVIADHLLKNGVIVPPCKVGDMVWYLKQNYNTKTTKVKSGKVVRIAITQNEIDLFVDNNASKLAYGKRAFLTEVEAKAALKARENK